MPLKLFKQLVFLLAFLPCHSFAQDTGRSFNFQEFQQKNYQKNSVTSENKTSPKNSDLRSSLVNQDWKVWTQATAVPAEENSKSFQRFQIQQKAQSINSEKNFNKNNPLVMYNPDSKNTGLLTGTIKVSLATNQNINSLLADYNLKLLHSFPDINAYFITSNSDSFDLEELYKKLQEDERLTSVDTEILSRVYEKK